MQLKYHATKLYANYPSKRKLLHLSFVHLSIIPQNYLVGKPIFVTVTLFSYKIKCPRSDDRGHSNVTYAKNVFSTFLEMQCAVMFLHSVGYINSTKDKLSRGFIPAYHVKSKD